MSKIELEILGLSSSQSQTGSFALVLGEVGGKRRLPIIIGMAEAQAIAIEIEKITPHRPFTHDLFKEFAKGFNFDIHEIMISDLKEGIFYAKIVCSDEIKSIEVDSRPSDAIAIALRFKVPIFTNEKILSEAGIVLTEEEEKAEFGEVEDDEEQDEEEMEKAVEEAKTQIQSNKLDEFSVQQLEVMLEDALKDEKYELAARIRDELNRR